MFKVYKEVCITKQLGQIICIKWNRCIHWATINTWILAVQIRTLRNLKQRRVYWKNHVVVVRELDLTISTLVHQCGSGEVWQHDQWRNNKIWNLKGNNGRIKFTVTKNLQDFVVLWILFKSHRSENQLCKPPVCHNNIRCQGSNHRQWKGELRSTKQWSS